MKQLEERCFGGLRVLLTTLVLLQEFQIQLAQLQDFPWAVATGDDEKHLRALGKLPPKKRSAGEAFISWSVFSVHQTLVMCYISISFVVSTGVAGHGSGTVS